MIAPVGVHHKNIIGTRTWHRKTLMNAICLPSGDHEGL
jgi:hypothetical protein